MPSANKSQKPFYQLSVAEAMGRLGCDPRRGLAESEAQKRWARIGPNQLAEGKKRSPLLRFLDQFRDFLVILLVVAALFSYYLRDLQGGTVLLAIVFMNAVIGFYQEFKAEKVLEQLRQVVQARATVIRDGHKHDIPQEGLVPGDLVYLEEGSSIPADLRLIQSTNFSTNDVLLTGESVAQPKNAALVFDKELTLTDQDNLVFMGVTVTQGNATGVVFATGMETAIGQIARTSEAIEHDLSPLQKEMAHVATILAKVAGVIALVIFGTNLVFALHSRENLRQAVELSFLFAISVAAACVPQGLPAQVSVALSLGVGRMAKRKAVVRKLSAVETLGATTVICSDKTGTLTKNEMTITHAYTEGRLFEVSGQGYNPKGEILENGKKVAAKTLRSLKPFFADGFLASNGRVNAPDHAHRDWVAIGDPTEAAFAPLAIKAGLDPGDLEKDFPLLQEFPFDSDRKRMTMIREHKGKRIAYMKGGLETVLEVCDRIQKEGGSFPLSEAERRALLKTGEGFAAQALRVIALAYRDFPKGKGGLSIQEAEREMVFAGFVTMLDPPRAGAKEALQAAYKAHLRVVMITGDNALTAQAIAHKIGMASPNETIPLVNGDEVREWPLSRLKKALGARSIIFSRVSPQDKYKIVSALKEMGEVVAVTGDGVNDTLSLKKADIGVAMGKGGSAVAKEAAEMVLLDDNFKTIVAAIREGRTLFQNLRKTILANIVGNNAELSCVLLGVGGMLFGLPAPITAVQILAIDMLAEIMPLAALTFDPGEESEMRAPPRNLKEHVLSRRSLPALAFYGFCIGAMAFLSFGLVYRYDEASLGAARACAYLTIVSGQFMNILCSRTQKSLFSRYLFSNTPLWFSFLLSLGLIALVIYVKTIAGWFGFEAVPLASLRFPALGALLILVLHEVRKAIRYLSSRNA